jgi:hypothetical protein
VHRGAAPPTYSPVQSRDKALLSVSSRRREEEKVALVAYLRELLAILNAMIRDMTPWKSYAYP